MAKDKTSEAPVEGATPAAAAPAMVREKSNGVTRPSTGTATGRVWEIADALGKAKGGTPARKDVLEAGKAEGLNESTITTQYGRYLKFYGLNRSAVAANAAVAAGSTPSETPVVSETPEVEEPAGAAAE